MFSGITFATSVKESRSRGTSKASNTGGVRGVEVDATVETGVVELKRTEVNGSRAAIRGSPAVF